MKIDRNNKIINYIEQWEIDFGTKYDENNLKENIISNLIYDTLNWLEELEDSINTNIDNYYASFKENIEAIEENKKKLYELRKNIKLIQKDYLNLILRYIMVIYKNSGIVVYSYAFSGFDMDEDLISGFLTAIGSFGTEITKKDTDMESIKYQDFEIEVANGTNIKVALILNGKKIDVIKKLIRKFINMFEMEYKNELKNWSGDVSIFNNANKLIDECFNFGNEN
ncbi:MAG: hypothetical protein ACTSRP_02425 [Candidatus Helarchaeota archaeon]